MSVKPVSCFIVECDVCMDPISDDYTVHWDTKEEALDRAEDTYEWHVLRDGRVICLSSDCEATLPDCVCEGDDCDADQCEPGCPCLLHAEVPPLEPCCGEMFANHAQRNWHQFRTHTLVAEGLSSTDTTQTAVDHG